MTVVVVELAEVVEELVDVVEESLVEVVDEEDS